MVEKYTQGFIEKEEIGDTQEFKEKEETGESELTTKIPQVLINSNKYVNFRFMNFHAFIQTKDVFYFSTRH